MLPIKEPIDFVGFDRSSEFMIIMPATKEICGNIYFKNMVKSIHRFILIYDAGMSDTMRGQNHSPDIAVLLPKHRIKLRYINICYLTSTHDCHD